MAYLVFYNLMRLQSCNCYETLAAMEEKLSAAVFN